ncbi:MAG: LytTR family DNA-binding domain-containing protein [Bacteroidota bacterium]
MSESSPLNVLIADDEPLARERLRTLLLQRSDVELAAEVNSGEAALRAVSLAQQKRKPIDLVLLDVQMPAPDGLDVAASLAEQPVEQRPEVVFVTAFDRYAIRAFDLHALDYVLKPIEDDRFHAALDWAVARRHTGQTGPLNHRLLELIRAVGPDRVLSTLSNAVPDEEPARRLSIQSGGRYHLIDADEIDWIEGAGVYVKLVSGSRSHFIRTTLARMEKRLGSDQFARIHRSTIVNLSRVREIHPRTHGEYVLLLEDGTRLKVSRTYSERMKRYVERFS